MATPFIIAIFTIIFVCLIIALIVASFLRANSAAEDDEPVLQSDPQAPANNSAFEHGTAPLPPFQPIPTHTQPLSEIYYYDDPVSSSQPLPPVVPPTLHPD